MKKYPAWQAPLLCFYSADFYADVAQNWRGIAFGYLTLMLIALWVCIAARWYTVLDAAMQSATPIVKQFPLMTLKDGELTIDKPVPYKIKGLGGGDVIVFDTTDEPKNYPDLLFVFTKDKLISPNSETGQSEFPYSAFPVNGKFDHTDVQSYVDMLPAFFVSLALVLMLPFSFTVLAAQALLLGLISTIVASQVFQTNLKYSQGVRMAVVASTPGMLALTLRWTFVPEPGPQIFALAWIGLAVGYTCFGTKAAALAVKAQESQSAESAAAPLKEESSPKETGLPEETASPEETDSLKKTDSLTETASQKEKAAEDETATQTTEVDEQTKE